MLACRASRHQGVSRRQPWKATEVAIRRPQLPDSMLEAQRRDASIMNLRAHDSPGFDYRPQFAPMAVGLGKQH